ncbi:MAG: hypothetical protein ACFCBW_08260, partial [Candidatus Competibacterales bacterium]
MNIDRPGSHADHLLRQTRMHHEHLSTMADLKANMLITLSSVIISLSLPHLDKPRLALGLGVMMGFCLATVVLSAYATMPKLRLRPHGVNHPRPDPTSPH